MKTILLTGKSGFLGARIYEYYDSSYNIIAPSHSELDITDEVDCMHFVSENNPDYIIHTAAIADTGYCEAHPDESFRVNVNGPVNLAKACKTTGSRLISMSSDQVYSAVVHVKKNKENDIVNPKNKYGQDKLSAEKMLNEILPDAISLRLTWMFDLPIDKLVTKTNFATMLLDSVNNGRQLTLSNNEYRGITYVREVVENIEKLFTAPGGVYNFGSPHDYPPYMLATKIFEYLGKAELTNKLINRTDYFSNLSLDQTKLNAAGISFSSTLDGIIKCMKEHNTGLI
ncbi:MAG TPA: hypothetical protein DDZ99_00265 [Clostridiales bacterium]|nr:hypothetical protein [Clostridiales bacterium]